jgi:hypothetical protein
MGLFYFHIRTRGQLLVDQEGTCLPDSGAARQEALMAARHIVADAIRSGNEDIPEAFVISDSEGGEIETLPFAQVLPSRLKY